MAQCLDRVRATTPAGRVEIQVVLNNLRGIDEDDARAFLEPWDVNALFAAGPFNWSRVNNQAAAQATGDYLLFLNDDIEPMRSGWLTALLGVAEHPGVGAVGAVLRYPDRSIQHAGIHISQRGGQIECRHTFRHCDGTEARVQRWLLQDRIQSAVTGACLLTPRRLFHEIGGFDPGLSLILNDVDFCLRLRQSGRLCAVAAGAELWHHEGMSRAGLAEEQDMQFFAHRWRATLPEWDAFGHPALVPSRDDWMFDVRCLNAQNVTSA